MSSRDRRPRFRAAVYAQRDGMTNGCRVLLLRLADSMSPTGVVSIPRSKLAKEFGVHPSRITENLTLARELGFIQTVRRGRPGVTAVYQGLVVPPPMMRPSAPSNMVRKPGGDMVRHSAPPEDPTWCATAVSQVGNASQASARTPPGLVRDVGSYEKTEGQPVRSEVAVCEFHVWQPCPSDCRNFDRRTA